MIGMNDGAFPHANKTTGFDLIAAFPQNGDRSPGKDGRRQFLEAITAAQQGIYFSYTGRSNRKNVEFPPSTLLQEFIDYIKDHYGVNKKAIVQEQRLQPFSPSYFKNNAENGLFSYSNINERIADRLKNIITPDSHFLTHKLPAPDDALKNITPNEWINFFQHPAKYLLQQRFGIYFQDDQLLDEDRESFGLNHLEDYQIGQEMLKRYLNNQSLESYQTVAVSKSLLPEGWPGMQKFHQKIREVQQFGGLIIHKTEDELLEPLEIQYTWNDFRVSGRLDQVYENEQLLYRFGKMRPKDLVELWIKHLLLQLVKPENHSGISLLITRDKNNPAALFRLAPPAEPHHLLDELFELFSSGLRQNIYFFPITSFAYTQAVLQKNKNEDQAIQAAQKKWIDAHSNFPKEGDDPYNKCLTGNSSPFTDDKTAARFKSVSRRFWEPFFEVFEKDKFKN
jgi:exodeoxyribonuclease V gamma subunit